MRELSESILCIAIGNSKTFTSMKPVIKNKIDCNERIYLLTNLARYGIFRRYIQIYPQVPRYRRVCFYLGFQIEFVNLGFEFELLALGLHFCFGVFALYVACVCLLLLSGFVETNVLVFHLLFLNFSFVNWILDSSC